MRFLYLKFGNFDTGELMFELDEKDKIKIIREGTVKYLNEKCKSLFRHFTKVNNKEFILLNKELTNNEKIFLFSIIPYIDYDTCKIKFNNQYNIKLIDLVNICNINDKTLRLIINQLIDKMIIYKDKKIYYINHWLMCKGEKINKSLFYMFCDYKVRSLGGKRWKELG